MSGPVNDPQSTEYPGRTFYGDRWMTQDQIEHKNRLARERYATEPMVRLKNSQRNSLREVRKTLERSIERAELYH